MKTERLQDALGQIRDDYMLDAHNGPAVRKKPWLRWGKLAACVCILAAVAVPLLLRGAPGSEPTPPISDPGPGSITEPDPQLVGPLGDWPVIYNQVDTIPDASSHYFALADRPLTETEKVALIPSGLSYLKLESARANFVGVMYEDGRLQKNAKLDSVELTFTHPDLGCTVRVGIWPAGQTSLFNWASQFDPQEFKATHLGGDGDTASATLFQYGEARWAYYTCDGVGWYAYSDGADVYDAVNAIFRSGPQPDLSILAPNP